MSERMTPGKLDKIMEFLRTEYPDGCVTYMEMAAEIRACWDERVEWNIAIEDYATDCEKLQRQVDEYRPALEEIANMQSWTTVYSWTALEKVREIARKALDNK